MLRLVRSLSPQESFEDWPKKPASLGFLIQVSIYDSLKSQDFPAMGSSSLVTSGLRNSSHLSADPKMRKVQKPSN